MVAVKAVAVFAALFPFPAETWFCEAHRRCKSRKHLAVKLLPILFILLHCFVHWDLEFIASPIAQGPEVVAA